MLRKTGSCEFKAAVSRAVCLQECVLGELPLTAIISSDECNDFLAVLLEFKNISILHRSPFHIDSKKLIREFPILKLGLLLVLIWP